MATPKSDSLEVPPPISYEFNDYEIHSWTYDRQRNEIWDRAIREVVQPGLGQVVVDASAGLGLLSMFAVRAGAERVYAVETNKIYSSKSMPGTIKRNGMEDRIHVLDTAMPELPELVDVILADVSHTGMIPQSPIDKVAWLSQYLKPGGKILPGKATHSIQLMTGETSYYGLDLCAMARWHGRPGDIALTTAIPYHTTDYYNITSSARIDTHVQVVGLQSAAVHGLANFVRISSQAQLTPSTETGQTASSWLSQMIPLDPVSVEPDQAYRISIAYNAGTWAKEANLHAASI